MTADKNLLHMNEELTAKPSGELSEEALEKVAGGAVDTFIWFNPSSQAPPVGEKAD
jgi:hypothetical protein